MSRLQIRPARREDCGVILELIRGLASYEKLLGQCVVTKETLEKSLFCESPVPRCHIGWIQDEQGGEIPVAFVLYFYNFSTFLGVKGLYLEDVFVKKEYRHRGYGRQLMEYLASLAVKEGCGRFEWSVLDWNQPAIDFYECLGANVMPDWRICRLTGDKLRELAGKGVAEECL